jgi:hypothetical protein
VAGEARGVEQRAHGRGPVGGEVVHDQHRGGLDPAQLGQEHLLEPGLEHRPVGRGRNAHGADDARVPERAQDGDALPVAARCHARGARAAPAPGMAAHQVGERGALVEEDEALGRDVGHGGAPAGALFGNLSALLLGGAQGLLFFRVSPRRPSARPRVQGCTRTPPAAASRSRYSASVRSGSASIRRRSVAAPSSRIVGFGPPRMGLALSRPSSRAAASQRYTVERPTAKHRATRAGDRLPSRAAATTRWRRSPA